MMGQENKYVQYFLNKIIVIIAEIARTTWKQLKIIVMPKD